MKSPKEIEKIIQAYIDHVGVNDDFLVAIHTEEDGLIKELYLYDYTSDSYLWENDWWEGQPFELIAFVHVSNTSIDHNWVIFTQFEDK